MMTKLVLGIIIGVACFAAVIQSLRESHITSIGSSEFGYDWPVAGVVSGLDNEALDLSRKEFSKHFSIYGDSILTRPQGSEGSVALMQFKGIQICVKSDVLSTADQLNGLEWRGSVEIISAAERVAWPGDTTWGEWSSSNPDNPSCGVGLEKHNGVWSLSTAYSDLQPVPCDSSGNTPIDVGALAKSSTDEN
jgi:hypothetical protein